MRRTVWVLSLALVCTFSIGIGSQQPAVQSTSLPAVPAREPSWAFPVQAGKLEPEPPGPKSVPGSTRKYTPQEIDDLLAPPDWFPNEHPPAPPIVQKGHGAALACGSCHLMSGLGHPESAELAGFTAGYLMQQMADFKSGVRKDYARMNGIAKEVSEEESRQAAEWFASLKPLRSTRVLEAANVPKTIVAQGRMRFVAPEGGMEPIGNRIITVPEDQERARLRDPKSGFIAYVPVGSIAQRQDARRDRRLGEERPVCDLSWRRDERAGQRAQARGASSDLHRSSAPPVQGRLEERCRCAADEEGGRGVERRRHPGDFSVSGLTGSLKSAAASSGCRRGSLPCPRCSGTTR